MLKKNTSFSAFSAQSKTHSSTQRTLLNAMPAAVLVYTLAFSIGCPTTTGEDPEPSTNEPGTDAGLWDEDAGAGVVDAGSVDDGGIEQDLCEGIELGADGLGSLELHASYSVVDAVAVPTGLSRAAFLSDGNGDLVGVGIDNTSVRALGVWPDVAKGDVLFEIIDPVDVDETHFLSPYLTATEGHIAAGYTMIGDGFPGKVALYNRATSDVQYLSAPGNYTASLDDTHLYIDALGANAEVGNGIFVYDMQDEDTHLTVSFADVDFGGTGFCLVTDDVLLAGYSDSFFSNHTPAIGLSAALAAADIDAALDANTFDSALSGSIVDATRFGSSGAFLIGEYDANFNLVLQTINAVSLTVEMDGVSVGPEVEVLTFDDDACISVDYITSLGDDLVLQTRIGSELRLVRIRESQ
ncbi:MAG: hypothetical protein GY822_08795 [Deltaproteobacteria bacterium]|nr:hypothetical protein [Deltaproteobacteria bacterium]